MKPPKFLYIFVIIGLIITMMIGIGIAILAFSESLYIDNLPYRIMVSAIGIYLFTMFFGGLQMALKYKKETFLSDNERSKQWKNLNPHFKRLWAFLMNMGTGFFAIGVVFAIISMIVYGDWTHGMYTIPFIGLLIQDIRSRKRHPEQYKLISIHAIENIKPPFWKRFYRHIIWSPIAFIYAFRAFFSKQKRVSRWFLFGLLYKAFKGDRGCYTWYTIEECMNKWNIKAGRKARGKK